MTSATSWLTAATWFTSAGSPRVTWRSSGKGIRTCHGAHMEAVRNAFSVALSLCWGDKQHMFCKETYHDSWKIFEARNGGLYRLYCRSTGPTFRCPNHCINASTRWAYRTRCLKSKQETAAAFSLDGNEDVHFKKDSTAVDLKQTFSSFIIPIGFPGTADALSCFERVATTPTINPHTISQPSWHQGLVFQQNKLQILCPLVEGIPHATYLFGIPHASSTCVEHLSSETSRNATFQEGSAVDANEIDLNYLAPSLASQCVGPRPSPYLLLWKIW